MKRRTMLMMPALAMAGAALTKAAAASPAVQFSQGAYEDALASGEPFLLDFKASW